MEESFGSVWQVTHRGRSEAPQEDPGRLPLSLGDPHQLHLGLHDPHTDPTAIVPPTKSPHNTKTWHGHCLSRLPAPSSPSQRASPTAQSMPGWG